MQILKLFSIYDEKAAAYITPFYMPTPGLSIRTFTDCVADNNHQFSKHPEDYTLFHFGDFDMTTGKHDMLEKPVVLLTGLEARAEILNRMEITQEEN